jgi:hypothetical protein
VRLYYKRDLWALGREEGREAMTGLGMPGCRDAALMGPGRFNEQLIFLSIFLTPAQKLAYWLPTS